MKVKNLKTEKRLGIKEGEIYEATTYPLDPAKVILVSRIPDGYEPLCTQYRDSVEIIKE